MTAYSLVYYYNGKYTSKGIYTNLDNLYIALQDYAEYKLDSGLTEEEIKDCILIVEVELDSEPLYNFEFSCHGSQIPIDWNKIF